MTTDHEELKAFFSGYFHQDWLSEANSSDEVITQFFSDEKSTSELDSIVRGLLELLSGVETDDVLTDRLFREFGSYYLPSADGLSSRQWLTTVLNRFEGELDERGRP